MMYVCSELVANECVAWVESPGLSVADFQSLLPAIVLVLVVAFAFRLIRRFLLR